MHGRTVLQSSARHLHGDREARSMTYAVHSIWSPAVEIDQHGTMTHNEARISLPAPIYTADTWQEAEAWRLAQLEGLRS